MSQHNSFEEIDELTNTVPPMARSRCGVGIAEGTVTEHVVWAAVMGLFAWEPSGADGRVVHRGLTEEVDRRRRRRRCVRSATHGRRLLSAARDRGFRWA